MALTDLVGRLLPALDTAFPTDLVGVLAGFLAEHADADSVELLLADYELEHLVRVRADEPAASARSVPVPGTWNLLPVRAFAGPHFEIAGQLMPAYEVGGDCFDYSVKSTGLYLTVSDAMGHGVQASLLDTPAICTLRNSRRAGGSPADQAQQAQAALTASARPPRSTASARPPRSTASAQIARPGEQQ